MDHIGSSLQRTENVIPNLAKNILDMNGDTCRALDFPASHPAKSTFQVMMTRFAIHNS